MQIVGDVLIGGFIIFVCYKLILKFGSWTEKRAEKIIDETKKEITRGQ